MNRREFVRGLLAAGALAAMPSGLVVRKIWQVPRNAPVFGHSVLREYAKAVAFGKLYGYPSEIERLYEWLNRHHHYEGQFARMAVPLVKRRYNLGNIFDVQPMPETNGMLYYYSEPTNEPT